MSNTRIHFKKYQFNQYGYNASSHACGTLKIFSNQLWQSKKSWLPVTSIKLDEPL